MKLIRIRIHNFRSFVGTHEIDLNGGLNCIVGPNNTGKSNLLRALGLALQELAEDRRTGAPVSIKEDLPQFPGGAPRRIRIQTTFSSIRRPSDRRFSPERRLLQLAHRYEQAANPDVLRRSRRKSYASNGLIVHNVEFAFPGGDPVRTEYLSVAGLGNRNPRSKAAQDYPKPGSNLHENFYGEFRRQVRFVAVRSGEALESVLAGPFREVLEGVIQDHLAVELETAREARSRYREHLQTQLLKPLSARIADTTGGMFPEVSTADLLPGIPTLQETLSSMGVQLHDAVQSDLSGKGTGVRAGVLVAILRYLSEQSKRSLVFAVEEPESFLHPAAQEDLKDALLNLAATPDTTVLISTHSPFMVPERDASGVGVISVQKTPDGHSHLRLDQERVHVGSLFRDPGVAQLLELAQGIPSSADYVLIVEGATDADYLRLGCTIGGRADLLQDVHMVVAGGAYKLPAVAVLMAAATAKPVLTLLDSDEAGDRAAKRIRGFEEKANRIVLKLGGLNISDKPVVAEDLWPKTLRASMVSELGPSPRDVKANAVRWLTGRVGPADCGRVIAAMEWIRSAARSAAGSG